MILPLSYKKITSKWRITAHNSSLRRERSRTNNKKKEKRNKNLELCTRHDISATKGLV